MLMKKSLVLSVSLNILDSVCLQGYVFSKSLFQKNSPFLAWVCQITQVDV